MNSKMKALAAFLEVILWLLGANQIFALDRPNFLILTTEDISPHLNCYGYDDARTPNLDEMAKQGVLYTNAFMTAPVCAVARAAMATGVYSCAQGTHHMRNKATIGNDVETIAMLLDKAGYYCANQGKLDYQGFPKAGWKNGISYASRPNKDATPFIQVINYTETHERFNGENTTRSKDIPDAAAFTSFPPYYPDTEKARKHWAIYYANIARMDNWVKGHLDDLEESGEAGNTIAIFYSDHGVALPRGKRWAYDSGLKVPWIVRVPSKWQHVMPHKIGAKTDELIGGVDLAPTLLTLAGVTVPEYMQGRPFMGEELSPQSDYVHGHRDRIGERSDIVRTVRDNRYRYIRNYEYFKPHWQFTLYAESNDWSGIMEEIRRVHSELDPPPEVAWYFEYKPIEELYDIQTDPHEMEDLASDPAYQEKLEELRSAHLEWRREVRDLGVIPEGIILQRRGKGSEFDYGLANAGGIEEAWEVFEKLHLYTAKELIELLSDKDEVIRYWAAVGLGNLGENTKVATGALTGALEDGSPWVRVAAARGLLLLGDSKAGLDALRAGLKHSNDTVKLQSMIYADNLGSRVKDLKPLMTTDGDSYFAEVAARALATINNAPEIPPVWSR